MAFSSQSRARKPVLSTSLLWGGALLLSIGARADVYHPVTGSETLASIAAKYHVSAQSLREANGLTGGDSSPLGSMLLRVPGVKEGQVSLAAPQNAFISTPAASPVVQTPSFSSSSRGGGSLSRAVLESVRAGDTWETIATRYRAAGNDVSAEAIRRRNGDVETPVAGQNVVVPLGQLNFQAPPVYAPRVATNAPVGRRQAITPSYTSSAQTVPSAPIAQAEPRNLGGGVYASGEFNLGSKDIPISTIREIPQSAPIFGSTSIVDTRRGGLASRGGYGEMARRAGGGEVRVLGQNEVAIAPQGGQDPTATTAPVRPYGSMARVGQVSGVGARIRRLPQADAATLYKCGQGTRLAVLRQSGAWSAVLMSDRSTGWLPTKYLSMTEQTVDVSSQIVATPGPGGSVGNGTRYATQSPTVAQALRWLGTPYVYGGTTRRGIDCSSLVQHAFAACGVQLPRTAATQARVGMAVAPADLQAGDRLYFSASGTRIDHTGLYMGNGLFVHASGSGHRVMISNLFQSRNWNIFVGARR